MPVLPSDIRKMGYKIGFRHLYFIVHAEWKMILNTVIDSNWAELQSLMSLPHLANLIQHYINVLSGRTLSFCNKDNERAKHMTLFRHDCTTQSAPYAF